jgi:GAF domain-containing protein
MQQVCQHARVASRLGLLALAQPRKGPCWDTTRGGQKASVYRDIVADRGTAAPRSYREAAGRAGIRSQISVGIRPRNRTVGAVTVISTSSYDPPIDAETLGVVAGLAALAVEQSRLRDGIELGLRGRTIIGEALGILMERFQLSEDVALRYLKRQSSNENRKLRDVAADIAGGHRATS